VFGENSAKERVDHFEYIVNSILPFSDENKDKTLTDGFIKALKEVTTNTGVQ